jgi:transposase
MLSDHERDLIYDYTQQHLTCQYHELLELVDYKISESTLRALLKDLGLRKWRKFKRSQLNGNDAVNRFAWAHQYQTKGF